MDNNIGIKLDGRYELLELIGVGGMADIYRARDIQEDRIVAVKILKTEFAGSDEFLRRFRNESKAIALLSHPNIVKIYDVGFTDKVQFIVMEYVDGITLTDYIEQQGVLKWRDAVHFTVQVLRALQHAHDRGIVHRDVKSSNIMLLRDGTIKVMDFGIARFNRENNKTMSEKTIGSVHYISPEQARGDITDERSDIYSVGVALYEMLTGRKPFDGDTPVAIALKHMQSIPKRPSEINETIPEGLEQIVLHAMQKDPSARYQTAGEMISDLEEFKKNPGIVFDYKYNSTDGSAKYIDRPNPAVDKEILRRRKPEDDDEIDDDDYYDDDDDEYEERRSPLIPILFAVGAAFVIATVFLLLWLINERFGSGAGGDMSSYSDGLIVPDANGEFSMPKLVDMTWDEAKQKYGSYLTLVGTTENSDVEKDHIIKHDPPEGKRVKLNQTVVVTVSAGRRMSEIYDFKGRQASYAIQQLNREGFKAQTTSRIDDTIPKDCVIETNPPAHTMAEQGTTVIVIVSMGPKNSSVEVPKLTEISIDEAQKKCNESYLNPTIKHVSSELPEGTVIEQSIEPGKMVDRNTTIELTVSSGEMPTATANLDIALPAGITGEFEFRYFVNGKLQNAAEPDIRDLSLSSNRTISYKVDGRIDETDKRFVIKVISRDTSKEGVYTEISIDFSQEPPKPNVISQEPSIFHQLQQGDSSDPSSNSDSGSSSSDSSDSGSSGSSGASAADMSNKDKQALLAAIKNRNFDDYGDLMKYSSDVTTIKGILSKYGYNPSSGTGLSGSDLKLLEALLRSGGLEN